MTHTTDTKSSRGRLPFDYAGADTVSMAVVFAAAEAAGVDPVEAPPLADVINPTV
ncbi:MAG: HalOD1 output domain-containing protein [Halanaeroarchaeum sp.]